jgi:hypothetical protein
MLAVVTDDFSGLDPWPPSRQRRRGEMLGNAARVLLIAAAVILAVGGLAVVGFVVVAVASLNSWASNK